MRQAEKDMAVQFVTAIAAATAMNKIVEVKKLFSEIHTEMVRNNDLKNAELLTEKFRRMFMAATVGLHQVDGVDLTLDDEKFEATKKYIVDKQNAVRERESVPEPTHEAPVGVM